MKSRNALLIFSFVAISALVGCASTYQPACNCGPQGYQAGQQQFGTPAPVQNPAYGGGPAGSGSR